MKNNQSKAKHVLLMNKSLQMKNAENNIMNKLIENYKENDGGYSLLPYSIQVDQNLHESLQLVKSLIQIDSENNETVLVIDSELGVSIQFVEYMKEDNFNLGNVYVYNFTDDILFSLKETGTIKIKEITFDELSEMYASGVPVEEIEHEAKIHYQGKELITDKYANQFLKELKERHVTGKSKRLTEELKKIIANRDQSGVPRNDISAELQVSFKTVKRACERYGMSSKNTNTSSGEDIEELFTDDTEKVKMLLSGSICPKCAKKVRTINNGRNNDSYYCNNCLNEFTVYGNECYKIRWELID